MAWAFLISAAAGYVFGSVPSSYMAGRLLKKIDIRDFGSGNTGATNVFRTLGPLPGTAVLLADIAKGWLPVFLIVPAVFPGFGAGGYESWGRLTAGVAAVCGHNWPVFLGFRGGKGVAVSVGALLGISPVPLSLSAAVWVLAFVSSGYVSLGSIAGAASLPVFMRLSGEPPEVLWFGVLVAVFITVRHRTNIIRLVRGKENRFNLRKPLV